jgi:molybdate transport system substrate-binding protein
LSLLRSALGGPNDVSIAAAANFVYAVEAINSEFKRTQPDIVITTTVGATGSLFAQIRNGAPFDLLLAADTEYPKEIVAAGLGDASSLQTFATGRLVAWTTRPALDLTDLIAAARQTSVRKIALAQPKVAPYGRAAQATLERLGVWSEVRPKLVFGESIAQTMQFIETGNADWGFVALSLVRSPRLSIQGTWKEVPPEFYREVSLDHAAVLTIRGAANPGAKNISGFCRPSRQRKSCATSATPFQTSPIKSNCRRSLTI